MNKVLRIARRAATASPNEWWTRGSQVMFAVRNCVASRSRASALSKQGHQRALGVRSSELCTWWADRRTQWFLNDERVESLRATSHSAASEIPWILERADEVLANRLPLFSYETVEYVGPNRWHRDFILKKTSPMKFHGFVPYLDPSVVGDSKHVWEPNRFAWAIWLGIAYRITGELKYADKFRQWTLDWFRCNPYPIGINYCSALESAFRNYAWLWSLSLFSDYLESENQLLEEILRGIWTGSRHVEENLSTYFAPNTHILGEAFGLFAVGAAIPEFRDSTRWRRLGLKLLETEAEKQFYQDGMHRELSSGYHIYSTDFYLQAVQIGRESGFRLPPKIEEVAKRAARRLAELVPENLIMPQFNDCDGGRLMSLVPQAKDAGPTLMAAADIFPNESFLPTNAAATRRGYPLLMSPLESKNNSARLRRKTPTMPIDRDLHRIYDSGIAAHRSKAGDYVLLRATDFGYDDCPHSHDAGLGVLLNLEHVPVFVDSGVGSYTQSEASRNRFRHASGKNTILVNGSGPSEPEGWFSWNRTTSCSLVSKKRFSDGFRARGKHSGFSERLDCHATVQREIIMLDCGIIAIVDRWNSDEEIAVESRFTLNPQLEVDPVQQLLQISDGVTFHFAGMSLIGGQETEFTHNQEPFSPDYGLIVETRAISHRHPVCARGGIVTFVSRRGPAQRTTEEIVSFQDGALAVHFKISPDGLCLSKTNPIEQRN